MSAIAGRLGAPSGSIYHRFNSRDVLVASLWLRAVERFHDAITPALDQTDAHVAIRDFALKVLEWTRANPLEAQLLVLHRSSDLLHDGWPTELTERNKAQRSRIQDIVDSLCERLGATTAEERQRVAFAAIDIPYAAVRTPLSRGQTPPADLATIIADAVTGVLHRLHQPIEEPQ